MKRTSKLITMAALLILLLIPLSAAASQVAVSKANFPVIINGRVVENDYREYPFILYDGITYFPMTYEDCAYLGLENNWTQGTGNTITKTQSSGYYRDFIGTDIESFPANAVATVVNTPITVMGEAITNTTQQYPILNYNDVLYFPLTWDWGQKFGWSITFYENKQLEVATGDFADIGYYYVYNLTGASPIIEKVPVTEYAHKVISYEKRSTHSYSPEYIMQWKEDNGFTPLINMESEPMVTVISVNNSERAFEFLSNGWIYTSYFENDFQEFLMHHSVGEANSKLTQIQSAIQSVDGKYPDFVPNTLHRLKNELMTNYVTVCGWGRNDVSSVRKGEAASFYAGGYVTPTDFIINQSVKAENEGNLYEALNIIECYVGSQEERPLKNLPYLGYDEYDCNRLNSRMDVLSKKLASQTKQKVVFGHCSAISSYGYRYFDVVFRNTTNQTPEDILVSFDIVDSAGKALGTYTANLNNYEPYTEYYSQLAVRIFQDEYPTAAGIKNIQFSKIKFYPLGMEPAGGMG